MPRNDGLQTGTGRYGESAAQRVVGGCGGEKLLLFSETLPGVGNEPARENKLRTAPGVAVVSRPAAVSCSPVVVTDSAPPGPWTMMTQMSASFGSHAPRAQPKPAARTSGELLTVGYLNGVGQSKRVGSGVSLTRGNLPAEPGHSFEWTLWVASRGRGFYSPSSTRRRTPPNT